MAFGSSYVQASQRRTALWQDAIREESRAAEARLARAERARQFDAQQRAAAAEREATKEYRQAQIGLEADRLDALKEKYAFDRTMAGRKHDLDIRKQNELKDYRAQAIDLQRMAEARARERHNLDIRKQSYEVDEKQQEYELRRMVTDTSRRYLEETFNAQDAPASGTDPSGFQFAPGPGLGTASANPVTADHDSVFDNLALIYAIGGDTAKLNALEAYRQNKGDRDIVKHTRTFHQATDAIARGDMEAGERLLTKLANESRLHGEDIYFDNLKRIPIKDRAGKNTGAFALSVDLRRKSDPKFSQTAQYETEEEFISAFMAGASPVKVLDQMIGDSDEHRKAYNDLVRRNDRLTETRQEAWNHATTRAQKDLENRTDTLGLSIEDYDRLRHELTLMHYNNIINAGRGSPALPPP